MKSVEGSESEAPVERKLSNSEYNFAVLVRKKFVRDHPEHEYNDRYLRLSVYVDFDDNVHVYLKDPGTGNLTELAKYTVALREKK